MRAGWLLVALCMGLAGAQEIPAGTSAQGAPLAANAPAAPKLAGRPLLPDKPYAGVREYDRDQKKADGSTLHQHETTKLWRDSGGRVRTEVTRDKDRVVWSYLTDPTAKVQYRWNNVAKVAYTTKLGEPVPVRTETNPLQPGELRKVSVVVNGQRLRGTRSLQEAKIIDGQQTIAWRQVLYSDPEQKTQVETEDHWFQPEYHVTLAEEITDLQYGHRVYRFKSFKMEEPKADLFQVPKGFTIKAAETPDTEQFE